MRVNISTHSSGSMSEILAAKDQREAKAKNGLTKEEWYDCDKIDKAVSYAEFLIYEDDAVVQEAILFEGGIIGRKSTSTLSQTTDEHMSGRHCFLKMIDNQLYLVDNKSMNG